MGDIDQYMQSPVFSIGSECTLSEVILFFHTQRVEALFVEEDGRYIGIVVKSDVAKRIHNGRSPEISLVCEVMAQPIPCLDHRSSVQEANSFMANNRIQYTAVTENRLVIGLLSRKDLIPGIKDRSQ